MDILPSFLSMPPDDRVWRIDWFGECAYPGNVRRYAQPSIKVVLSPLKAEPSDRDRLLQPNCTEYDQQREFWAPIAALPMLAIGDLWQGGKQLASPDYQTENFKGLTITPESSMFVKAGLALDEHFLLPWSHHPWHRRHTHSYCVAVSLGNQRRLLIPCVELIRFYFGSSSNFLQRLFTGPMDPVQFWTHKHFNSTTKHLHLKLANRLSGLSAPDMGRIAQSNAALRSAAGIYISCLKAIGENRPVYPYTGFPFQGKTDLLVSGRWLPFGELEDATFLVYRLKSCSHPFPFRSLSYEAGDKKMRAAAAKKSSTEARPVLPIGSKQDKTVVAETDPGANTSHRTKAFSTQHRFPDLVRKSVWREKGEEMPPVDIYRKTASGTLQLVGLGESDHHAKTASLDVLQQSDGDLMTRTALLPRFVRQGIKMINGDHLRGTKRIVRGVVPPAGSNQPVFSLPVVVDDDGVINEKHLFTEVDGHVRQRRGCFIELEPDTHSARYLLILEGSEAGERPSIQDALALDVMSCV